jgi:nitrogen regulatory protein PII 1
MASLCDAGYPSLTKIDVYGRGKQRGIKIGDIHYDELPKELLLIAVNETDKDFVIRTIMDSAKTGEKGAFGDGKIFISPIDEVYTISSGQQESAL